MAVAAAVHSTHIAKSMQRKTSGFVGAMLIASALGAQPPTSGIAVETRLELMAIVFGLGGASEFSQTLYAPYDTAIKRHFESFRNHEAIALGRDLHGRGVTFSTVMRLAASFDTLPTLEPRLPYDSIVAGRVTGAKMQRFAESLRRFVIDARADEFFAAHRTVYDSAAQRLGRVIDPPRAYRWAGEFFGVEADRDFKVAPLLANSRGNYGECVRPSRGPTPGRLECWQIIGHQSTDSAGFPLFDSPETPATFVHEIGHSYVNPLGDARRAEFERSVPQVHEAFSEVMAGQGYSSWTTMLNESLVRAAVSRYFAAHGTPDEQRTYMGDQRAIGWLWLDELAALFGDYERDRRTYPTLESFMPRVVSYYEALPHRVSTIRSRYEAARPRVVSISLPAAEGAGVDPALREIIVRFDRPVRDDTLGLVPLFVNGRPTSTQVPPPPVTGHALDAGGTTLHITINLEPGREYAFQLNTPNGFGFRAMDGVPLAAYPIRFRTRDE
jgi:hypothetical protein